MNRIMHSLVLVSLLALSSTTFNRAEAQNATLKGKGRLISALRQVNLSQQQIMQINSIKQTVPKGARRQQIVAVLTPAQKKQLHAIMKSTKGMPLQQAQPH